MPNFKSRLPNPNAPLRILSLDGGGVRGLSSLYILKDIMRHITESERRIGNISNTKSIRPCDYFDLIGGTSTGGIIAVLLGRLQLSVDECIDIYRELSKRIFSKERTVNLGFVRVPYRSNRFSGKELEATIKETLGRMRDRGFTEEMKLWDDSLFPDENNDETDSDGSSNRRNSIFYHPLHEQVIVRPKTDTIPDITLTKEKAESRPAPKPKAETGCPVLVVTTIEQALGLPVILSSYQEKKKSTKVWEALRATSAAPTFFESARVGNSSMNYLDGGMGWNNPCCEIVNEARSLWRDRPIGVVVSLGTGIGQILKVQKPYPWLPFNLGKNLSLAHTFVRMATSTTRVHNEMDRECRRLGIKYFRFDAADIGKISLEQWMREDEIAGGTDAYLYGNQAYVQGVAKMLVDLTRLPSEFAIPATQFSVGIFHADVPLTRAGAYRIDRIDFQNQTLVQPESTGDPAAAAAAAAADSPPSPPVSPRTGPSAWKAFVPTIFEHAGSDSETAVDEPYPSQGRPRSAHYPLVPIANPGISMNGLGLSRVVYPVREDLSGTGQRNEARVITCLGEPVVCLRLLRTNVPEGRYRVSFMVFFPEHQPGSPGATAADASPTRLAPPVDLQFSVGWPTNPTTFSGPLPFPVANDVDHYARILLRKAHRVDQRVDPAMCADLRGKRWQEVHLDNPVTVGPDGTLGIVVSAPLQPGQAVGEWSFGGVRIEPTIHDASRYNGCGGSAATAAAAAIFAGMVVPSTPINLPPVSPLPQPVYCARCQRKIARAGAGGSHGGEGKLTASSSWISKVMPKKHKAAKAGRAAEQSMAAAAETEESGCEAGGSCSRLSEAAATDSSGGSNQADVSAASSFSGPQEGQLQQPDQQQQQQQQQMASSFASTTSSTETVPAEKGGSFRLSLRRNSAK